MDYYKNKKQRKGRIRMKKKILLLLSTFILISGGLFSSISYASETNDNFTQKQVEQVAEELEFYFSEVGHIDGNGNYIITNTQLLQEKANQGDETANAVLQSISQSTIQPTSWQDYAQCILFEHFGTQIDLLTGDLLDAFISELQSQAWVQAAEIVLKAIGNTATNANAVALSVQLAIAASTCNSEL